MADPAEIDRILGGGAERAAAIAEPILARTYEIVGLLRRSLRPARRGHLAPRAGRGVARRETGRDIPGDASDRHRGGLPLDDRAGGRGLGRPARLDRPRADLGELHGRALGGARSSRPLALVELVTDQLPTTPSRKVPVQFGGRIVSGAFCGAVLGAAAGGAVARPRRGRGRRGRRHPRRRRAARPDGRGLRLRPAGGADRGRGRHRARAGRRGRWHDRRALRRRRHRRRARPGRRWRCGSPAPAGGWRSSSGGTSAAPASTPAAARPRR